MSDQRKRDSEPSPEEPAGRHHSDVVHATVDLVPPSGPTVRDSGEIEISEATTADVQDTTLVSGAQAFPPDARDDAMVDTERHPSQPDAFHQTLPADALAAAAQEAHASVATEDASLSNTLTASSKSYDSQVPNEPTPSLPDEDGGADPLIGMIVADRYRILERIGRGGMGIVYRVEHTSIGKLLAMKILTGELSANKEVVRRFKQEALTVSKLSSPHTVQVFDYGVWNHLTYLVMELVEGEDLGKALRLRGPIPFARLGKLMVQVCNSLAEAHEKGIVHRDIKPENIMIVADARRGEMAKVLDFGLAKLRENKELNEVTLQGAVIGTPYYMSPEQVMGDEVDGRTDIYSLGAVIFRAITGTQAFKASTPMAMFSKHLNEPPPLACERAPKLEIPDGVSDAVQRCMAKVPSERFGTIEELRDVLAAEIEALGLGASDRRSVDGPSSGGTRKRKERRPRSKAKSELLQSQIATRAELEGYERKLRRTKYGARVLLASILVGAAAVGGYYALAASKRGLVGQEHEPNDTAATAHRLSFGAGVKGQIGARLDTGDGDRDFYSFKLDGGHQRIVGIELTGLPNFPLCAILYRVDFPQPLAQYCTGVAAQDLRVSAVRLDVGAYLVAVVQDRNPRDGERAPFVLENVSDSYEITVRVVDAVDGAEIEPNDLLESAHILRTDQQLQGSLAWNGDEDVVCADSEPGRAFRWSVDDEKRPGGTILEVTPLEDGSLGPIVRLHGADTKPFDKPRLEADVNMPWTSPTIRASRVKQCLRLRLTTDPWSDDTHEVRPDPARYSVKLTRAK